MTNRTVEGKDLCWRASGQSAPSRGRKSQLIDVVAVVFARDLKHHSGTQWLVLDVSTDYEF